MTQPDVSKKSYVTSKHRRICPCWTKSEKDKIGPRPNIPENGMDQPGVMTAGSFTDETWVNNFISKYQKIPWKVIFANVQNISKTPTKCMPTKSRFAPLCKDSEKF